jgi:CRP-like cAMP-binding protein
MFIVKRGGLMVTTRMQQKLRTKPHRLSERAHFGTTGAIADSTYRESASATEELTQVLRLPATHLRLLRDKCALAARVNVLKKVPVLSTPSARPLLMSLAVDASIATFDEGTVIMGDGQQHDGKNLFLIESGIANMYRMTLGDPTTRQMRIFGRLGAGDYFGERVLLDPPSQLDGVAGGMSHSEAVVAVTDVQCIVLSRSSFDTHMGAHRESILAELSTMVDGRTVGTVLGCKVPSFAR